MLSSPIGLDLKDWDRSNSVVFNLVDSYFKESIQRLSLNHEGRDIDLVDRIGASRLFFEERPQIFNFVKELLQSSEPISPFSDPFDLDRVVLPLQRRMKPKEFFDEVLACEKVFHLVIADRQRTRRMPLSYM